MFWYIPQNIKWKSTCQYTTSEMTSADAEPLTCWHLSWQVYHLFLTCTTTEPAVGPGPWRHTSSIYCQSPCHLRSMVSVRLWGTSLIILSVSQNTSPTHWIKQEFRHFISLDNKFWQKWKHFLCFYSFHYIFLISRIKTNTSTKFSYKTTTGYFHFTMWHKISFLFLSLMPDPLEHCNETRPLIDKGMSLMKICQ